MGLMIADGLGRIVLICDDDEDVCFVDEACREAPVASRVGVVKCSSGRIGNMPL